MEEIKAYLIDFVEGRIRVQEFIQQCEINPRILDYVTSIAGQDEKLYEHLWVIDDNGHGKFIHKEIPYDARKYLHEELKPNCGGVLGTYLNIHNHFSRILISAFPNEEIKKDISLKNKHTFMLEACPEYIEGQEVSEILNNLLSEIPDNLSKTKRIKQFKDKVKKMFHIEGNKYPRWIQGGDWPISSSGKPMKFIEQKRKKGQKHDELLYTFYVFEDVDTGEQRVIEQFT